MTKVYLIRHCEAEGNRLRRCHGQFDSEATKKGALQAKALADKFAEIPLSAVYSSDLRRALFTASCIAKPHKMKVTTFPGLREIHMGAWEDKSWGDVAQHVAGGEEAFVRAPQTLDFSLSGGESMQDAERRLKQTLSVIAKHHNGETVAVVSHGMTIKAYLCRVLGKRWSNLRRVATPDNAAVCLIEYDGKNRKVLLLNDTSHLGAPGEEPFPETWYRKKAPWSELYVHFRDEREGERERLLPLLFSSGWKESGEKLCVGILNDEPAGFFSINCEKNDAVATGFCVLPGFEHKNVDVQLLGEALSKARSLKKQSLIFPKSACLKSKTLCKLLKDNLFKKNEDNTFVFDF